MAFGRSSLWPERTWVRALIAAFCGVLVISLGHFVGHIPELEAFPTTRSIASFLGQLFHELGFALIVSSAIYLTFEYFSKEASEKEWRDRIEVITSEVFYGVLRRNLPKELLAEANQLILNQSFVRIGLMLDYILEDCSLDDAGRAMPFVKVTAMLQYKVKNISDSTQNFSMQIAIPNPNVAVLKPHSDVIEAAYDIGSTRHTIDVEGKRAEFRKRLLDSNESHVLYHCSDIEISANAEVEILIRYVMPKEEEDTEIFETIYPSDSIRVTIYDRGQQRKRIGATAHHRGELEKIGTIQDGGPYQYRLNRYLLPHQGVSIWWKKA